MMKGLDKVLKILYKKYSLLFAVIFIGTIFLQFSTVKFEYRNISEDLASSIIKVEKFNNGTFEKDKDDYVDYRVVQERLKKPFTKEDIKMVADYGKKVGLDRAENNAESFRYGGSIVDYNIARVLDYDKGLISGSKILSLNFSLIILAVVVAFLLSSEFMTSFYKFMRQVPVKREGVYVAKVIFGILSLMVYLVVSLGINYLLVRNTPFGNILTFSGIGSSLGKNILKSIAIFLGAFGVGTVSGNIVGFFGMLIITFGGIILEELYLRFYQIFFNTDSITFSDLSNFRKMMEKNPIYSIVNSANTILDGKYILNIVFLCVLYFLIGLIVTKLNDGSRTTKCIVLKGVSKVIMVVAIITTVCASTLLINGIFGSGSGVGILMYPFAAFMLFVSYKFYKMLFEVNIGF
ncbi:ABC-2 family transporter protein [Peptoniphilus sp. BV3AC2]|uniref:ABC-2 family transporter protein n=1 Tax=Peptoniphilus sp. BV3AC2 TaxID=1111133 RepID=UPI0003B8F26E|nr:ABC-2 family transporter protein [Peptoniphilus sp. BV3AC2]ERT63499.1 ABC-2 family transporter protein [Peptoniphilus sp. BV3AC2]